ncbi:hypothetical protein [Tumebacillus avium]|uniref:hypothetical protein n=1 Tax=Tumebacillus avium TaxID=1903704 RepID=UPI0012FE59F8|nr:hypothetical protein [Tumebacillus avium]
MNNRNFVLHALGQALHEAKRSGVHEAVLRELPQAEYAWMITDRKGFLVQLGENHFVLDIFTSEEKAHHCVAHLQMQGGQFKGLQPTTYAFTQTFEAMAANIKPAVAVNRFSPEELTVSYENVEKHMSFK